MYKVDFLPSAQAEVNEIVEYISKTLGNPKAAERLLSQIRQEEERLKQFPNANPFHVSSIPLDHEYRKALVGNYCIFYRTDEIQKVVTISHIVYARRKFEEIL